MGANGLLFRGKREHVLVRALSSGSQAGQGDQDSEHSTYGAMNMILVSMNLGTPGVVLQAVPTMMMRRA